MILSMMHTGMKIKVALVSMIYRKSLHLSQYAMGDTTVGQVVNLMSIDVSRFEHSIFYIHYLWVGPLQTLAVAYLLKFEV